MQTAIGSKEFTSPSDPKLPENLNTSKSPSVQGAAPRRHEENQKLTVAFRVVGMQMVRFEIQEDRHKFMDMHPLSNQL